MELELLAPAKDLIHGTEAINHGADAVYIGAPAFGARVAAGNSVADIERLAAYAHRFRAKVFATVNTLLYDSELDDAVNMIRSLYNAGVDALIIQDPGLLECDLPPIELHASTQMHNASTERIKFLESVGFRRVILARETSLAQMRAIRKATTVDLEAFIHGALCVCYSGQCYMSLYLNGRSGNRGSCTQPCRSAYDLLNLDGRQLRSNEHLLSLRDFSAAQHLDSMIAAGVRSFKIEGRLKDITYVKNVTAYYRQLLDNYLEGHPEHQAASSGKTVFYFTPDPERTFNRGYTDYFLNGRHRMASHATQKSLGKQIGQVVGIGRNNLVLRTLEPLTAGDGLCFFDSDNQLQGFLVNRVEGNTVTPNRMPPVAVGTKLWRNNDFAFEKQLQGNTASRKIGVDIMLSGTCNQLTLCITDSDDLTAEAIANQEFQSANKPDVALKQLETQLAKLGNTIFEARSVKIDCDPVPFVPAAVINELRREAVEKLNIIRAETYKPKPCQTTRNDAPYFEAEVDYKANVINNRAKQFYERHHAKVTEMGLDLTHDYDGKALMTTKYCLRNEFGICLKTLKPKDLPADSSLLLRNNRNLFRLTFDCQNCQMIVSTFKKDSK
ncbi:MAG: U32 family peptidase [Bacteroidales bacterium]|nr:U32 family peptidase [Bacteroidales bacterium]